MIRNWIHKATGTHIVLRAKIENTVSGRVTYLFDRLTEPAGTPVVASGSLTEAELHGQFEPKAGAKAHEGT